MRPPVRRRPAAVAAMPGGPGPGGHTVKRAGCCLLAVLLGLPAARGDEPPEGEKKPPSAKERYEKLLKDFGTQQREVVAQLQKAQGPEQQRLFDKYRSIAKDFAEKFYKLAEDDPKDPVAADA